MTRQFFNVQFAAMANAYTIARSMADEAQDVYWECLKDVPEDQFGYAVKACLKANKFFPTIAELRESARAMPKPQRKQIDPPLSPEQREKNIQALREIIKNIGKRV